MLTSSKENKKKNQFEPGYNHQRVVARITVLADAMVGRNNKGNIRWKLFADEIGFSYDTIRTWIHKGSMPSLDRAYDFCLKIGKDLNWLVSGSEDSRSKCHRCQINQKMLNHAQNSIRVEIQQINLHIQNIDKLPLFKEENKGDLIE